MPLLGSAAMALFFDLADEAIAEHDDWHTHEHVPERISIPGFLRASRWAAPRGGPRYFILYEVADLDVLTSSAYLERLNNPTPWTAKMMQSYRGMRRGLCRVEATCGLGIGQAALCISFSPVAGEEQALREWLARRLLPDLASRPGLASAHLLASGTSAPMTREQQIRGKDAETSWVLLVTGYSAMSVTQLHEGELRGEALVSAGVAPGPVANIYQLEYSLSEAELRRAAP